MKTNIRFLLLISIIISIWSCSDSLYEEDQVVRKELKSEDPGCCDFTHVIETIENSGTCCEYKIRLINVSPNCRYTITGPKGQLRFKRDGNDIVFIVRVCEPKNIHISVSNGFQSILCFRIPLKNNCNPCPFTYDQGLVVGCGLAKEATSEDCCVPECSSLYLNTIEDFQKDCPEYVEGVIDGWNNCICPDDDNDGGGDLPCDGEDPPEEDCVCIHDEWECP